MPTFTLDHLHLRSPDPDKTGAFYTAHFGAEIIGRVETADMLRVMLDIGGLKLFVERVPPDTPGHPAAPVMGLEHIGLAVTDVDAAIETLRRNGVEITMEPTSPRPGLRIAFLRGPENVMIELLDRNAG